MARRVVLVGGTGFIGINLACSLAQRDDTHVVVAGRSRLPSQIAFPSKVEFQSVVFGVETSYSGLFEPGDVVVHLVSTTTPGTSNVVIPNELGDIEATARLLDACVAASVAKVIYLSSGGAVYGSVARPAKEQDSLDPISTYGLQKLAIEKLFGIYGYQHGLEYRIVRPSNPYGPWQDPRKGQGIVSVFAREALRGRPLVLYGDGSTIRDFIYIDDLTEGIERILCYDGDYRVFNLGSGKGLSMALVADEVCRRIPGSCVVHAEKRAADVPSNVLDMSRFEEELGSLRHLDISQGIERVIAHQRRVIDAGAL